MNNEALKASAELAALLAEDDLEARRAAVEQIKTLYDLRDAERVIKAKIAELDPSATEYPRMGALRRWLHDHEGERLHDDEHGLVAYLQVRSGSKVYDSPLAIRERDPALFQRLVELNCLQVDAAFVREAVKRGQLSAGDLAPYEHETVGTPALGIEKEE